MYKTEAVVLVVSHELIVQLRQESQGKREEAEGIVGAAVLQGDYVANKVSAQSLKPRSGSWGNALNVYTIWRGFSRVNPWPLIY